MSKLRWGRWFWADWSNDIALNSCSLPAQGLWMRLLCFAAQGDPYGSVTIKGRVPSDEELLDLLPRGMVRRVLFFRWLAELEAKGVAQRDHRGALFSARMQHDGKVSLARIDAAQVRWSASREQHDGDSTETQPGLSGDSAGTRRVSRDERHNKSRKAAGNGQPTDNLHKQKAAEDGDFAYAKSDFASCSTGTETQQKQKRPSKGALLSFAKDPNPALPPEGEGFSPSSPTAESHVAQPLARMNRAAAQRGSLPLAPESPMGAARGAPFRTIH